MDAELLVLIATVATAVVTGLFTVAAKRMAPRAERNATVVTSALELVEAYRRENTELRTKNDAYRDTCAELRREIEELRHRDTDQ